MNFVMNKWKNENEDYYGDYENISEDYRLTAGAVFTQFNLIIILNNNQIEYF